jgi:hypothetical protein
LEKIPPSTFLKEVYGKVLREDLLAIEGIEAMIGEREKANQEAGISSEYEGMSIPDKIEAMKRDQGQGTDGLSLGQGGGPRRTISTEEFRKLRKEQMRDEG